jgi:NADH-quinone oxidoreductase subunit J
MFEYLIFFTFAAIALIFSLVVVLHRNPVVSALSLVLTFFSLAVMYVLLDAAFMAALQVIVYAGAIMVLFLFVIMLLNLQQTREPVTRPIQHFVGITGAAAFAITLIYYFMKAAVVYTGGPEVFKSSAREIGLAMFQAYILPFEAVSILLLAAIVGALVLSQRSTATNKEAENR